MSQSQPRLYSTESKSAQDALITAPTSALVELRQNNPQDCANLIAASVDRATVEISRTIIALNATFSQQLQQASISASNGIKSAENSASSSISIVSQNASSATSSASFSLNLANLAVTSVNSALTNANIALASAQSQVVGVNLVLTSALSASTSDVLRLSSSLSSLEATLVSVQVIMTSPPEESAAYQRIKQASASTAVALAVMSQQSLKDPQVTATISLAPIVLAGIVVGTMLASILLSFAVGFVLVRARNKEKNDSFHDKGAARDPKLPLSSNSVAFRTGNSVVIKFSPPTSVHNFPPAPERHGSLSATPSALERDQIPIATVWDTDAASNNPFTSRTEGWPLKFSFTDDLDGMSDESWSRNTTTIPHSVSTQKSVSIPDSSGARELHLDNDRNITPISKFTPLFEKARDMDEESVPIRQHTRDSSYGLALEDSEQLMPAAEALEDPFKDPVMEPYESLVDGLSDNSVEEASGQSKQASINTQADDSQLEEPVGQEAKTFWNKPDEALLGEGAGELVTREIEDLMPEPNPSSTIIVVDTQSSGATNLPEQSETDNQRRSSQFIRITPPEQTQEHAPGKGNSSGIQTTVIQPLPESRDGTISPRSRNFTVDFLERRVEPQNPVTVDEEREVSPLRRNPPFEPFEAIISLLEERQGGAVKLKEEGGADEYESRGRSMIRTSDIIEARLSGLAQANQSREESLQQRGRKDELDDFRPISPASPGPQRFIASDQVHRIQTPPKRKPVAAQQLSNKNSSPLTSNSLSRPVSATSAAVTPRRDESSPLRRNPPDIGPNPRSALDARPTASSNAKEFSQALSKFQTLVSQNPQDAVVASNEVTSRAIAGIYIPGSLREQAVRNLSKSRERGTGERQKK